MKKLLIKIVLLSIIIITAISIFLLGILWCIMEWGGNFLCSNSLYRESVAPSEQYIAKVTERDCGATTYWSTHIIVESKQWFFPGSKEILIMRGQPMETGVILFWRDPRTLVVKLRGQSKIYSKESNWRDVKFEYENY